MGKESLRRAPSHVLQGTLLGKHPRTIAREIKRGQAGHVFDEGLQRRMVYNADRTETLR